MRKIILLVFFSFTIFGQNEFQVNTNGVGSQRDPHIVMDNSGNYAVIWQSMENDTGDIILQSFNSDDTKIGSEIIVNTLTEGEQERPQFAMNGNGDFVVVWSSHSNNNSIFDIKARVFKDGSFQGDEFLVNSFTENSQTKASVDMNEDGDFVVVWESWYQDGSNKGVYGQLFNSDGSKNGSEFLVNTTTELSQGRPVVKYLNNGNFIVVWESWEEENSVSTYDLYGKIFDGNGNSVKDEFSITAEDENRDDFYQWYADINVLSSGEFIVVYCSWGQDGHDGGIYLQKFSETGDFIGNEILVNQYKQFYQWTPKVAELADNMIAVVWSSWKQDGSREGVYLRYFDSKFKKSSFERKINDYTDGYQWEPSFVPGNNGEILAVWSTWKQFDEKYDIAAKRAKPDFPEGKIDEETYDHSVGKSTSQIEIHVVDSTKLTGHDYEISFEKIDDENWNIDITDANENELVLEDFSVNTGDLSYNITPEFDGVSVFFRLEDELAIDFENSYFKNNSSSNVIMEIANPSGQTVIAPIDLAFIWGNTDTTSSGDYANPLYNAYNGSGQLKVACPFKVWNLTDNEQVELYIPEKKSNDKWDPNEEISILTPQNYQQTFPNFHANVEVVIPNSSVKMPEEGDTLFIYTVRPITNNDKYSFSTDKNNIISSVHQNSTTPGRFQLEQNYPNPFNPTTVIAFNIPSSGKVKLNIYNTLGEKVSTLVDKHVNKGYHKKLFDGNGLVSGVYFYTLEFQNNFISKKMLLLK